MRRTLQVRSEIRESGGSFERYDGVARYCLCFSLVRSVGYAESMSGGGEREVT